MSKRKVIIVGHEPLTNSIKKNFYIDVFQQENIEVEYWDASRIIHQDLNLPDKIVADYNIIVENVSQFKSLVSQNQSAIYIVELYNHFKAKDLYKVLIDYSCLCGKLDSYSGCTVPLSLTKKLWLRLNSFYYRKPRFPYLLKFLQTKIQSLNAPKLSVSFFLNSNFFEEQNASSFLINSINYEKYIESSKGATREIPGKYAVFLDEYLPYHPDFKYLNGQSSLNDIRYFALLNSFFSKVEKKFGVEVVIAAHPKSNYDSYVFQNRQCIKFKTENLVRDSDFVITHSSLSVDFAILYKKPIFFTYTDELKKSIYTNYFFIKYRSALLGLDTINLDKANIDAIKIPLVNNNLYNNYKYMFLTAPQLEKQTNSELIISYIESLSQIKDL